MKFMIVSETALSARREGLVSTFDVILLLEVGVIALCHLLGWRRP